jgi:hypothetical protein
VTTLFSGPGPFGFLPEDYVLHLLSISTFGLLLVAIAFTLLTFLARRRNITLERKRNRLSARWDPLILEVLGETEEPGKLLSLVGPNEEFEFLMYLYSYARRVRGEEADVIRELAHPFLPVAAEEVSEKGKRRAQAIRILGLLGMPEYAPTLVEAMDDPHTPVALIAAESLLRPGSQKHLTPLLARLDRFGSWHPFVLARLLADVGPGAAPVLRPILMDPSQSRKARIVVIKALRRIRDIESADLAADLVATEDDQDLLVESLRLLAEVGDSRHRGSLVPLLQRPEFPIRSQALRALASVGNSMDMGYFRDALADPSPWVALEAARGLKALGGEAELNALAVSKGPLSTLALQVLEE